MIVNGKVARGREKGTHPISILVCLGLKRRSEGRIGPTLGQVTAQDERGEDAGVESARVSRGNIVH